MLRCETFLPLFLATFCVLLIGSSLLSLSLLQDFSLSFSTSPISLFLSPTINLHSFISAALSQPCRLSAIWSSDSVSKQPLDITSNIYGCICEETGFNSRQGQVSFLFSVEPRTGPPSFVNKRYLGLFPRG